MSSLLVKPLGRTDLAESLQVADDLDKMRQHLRNSHQFLTRHVDACAAGCQSTFLGAVAEGTVATTAGEHVSAAPMASGILERPAARCSMIGQRTLLPRHVRVAGPTVQSAEGFKISVAHRVPSNSVKNAVRSTFPPLRITPMRLLLVLIVPFNSGATATADEGSMRIFIRSQTKRMA